MQGLHLEEQMAVPPPLGLTMIVKNEADFIAQTLLSVEPHIDYWTIVDTGRISGLSRRRPVSLLPLVMIHTGAALPTRVGTAQTRIASETNAAHSRFIG